MEQVSQEETSADNLGKDIVLKAYMHCEGCCKKVHKCLKSLDGVEDVTMDTANHRVFVKGKRADPAKTLERLRNKYSRNVELISPLPKSDHENKEEPEEKKEEPQVKVVVLKMFMHCEGCANDIKKNIERMKGILTVDSNMETSQVTVRGVFDPPKLVDKIKRRLGKHVEIIKQEHGQDSSSKNDTEAQTVFRHPPQSSSQQNCLDQMFSDENVFSCSIM